MAAWVVLDRRHYRRAGTFALPLSTPPFPLPHLTPLLPYSYGHSSTTAAPQPLCNQSVTHSFYRHGGCTPLSLSTTHSPLFTRIELPELHSWRIPRRCTPMARITGADPSQQGLFHGLFTRIIYSMVKRKLGRVVTPVKIVAHHRKLLWGYGQMEQSLLSSKLVDAALKDLGQLRVATLVGCPF